MFSSFDLSVSQRQHFPLSLIVDEDLKHRPIYFSAPSMCRCVDRGTAVTAWRVITLGIVVSAP